MSVGALMIAPYADKFGRKKMMIISGLLMGLRFLSPLLQNLLIN
jgi:MFS family permease